MNTHEIVAQIDSEISKLQRAKLLLSEATQPIAKRGRGRPKGSPLVAQTFSVKPPKRVISEEGKAKIAAGQRARWAKLKKTAKKTV